MGDTDGDTGGQATQGEPGDVLRVLLIEDSEDLRTLMTALLEATGRFTVVGDAATAAEGIELLRQTQPDLLVLDYRLPDGTGAEVAHLARMASPRTFIALLSGLPARYLTDALADVDAVVEKGGGAQSLVNQLLEVVRAGSEAE